MRRRQLLLALALWPLAGPAEARSITDRVARDLARQGYTSIEVSRTLLGRDRVVASGPEGRREVILNPRTGEILRDLWTPSGSGQAGSGLISTDDDDGGGRGRGRGRGRGGDDDSGGDDSGGDDGGGDDGGGDD